MNLTLSETARYLGKTKRQIRYMIEKKELPARKVNDCWVINKEDLATSTLASTGVARKQKRARQIVDEVLGPTESKSSFFSVLDLRVFVTARDLCRTLPENHPAFAALLECLQALVCGCHSFRGDDKRRFFSMAREQSARALALLLLDKDSQEVASQLESQVIPAISSLIRGQERRAK